MINLKDMIGTMVFSSSGNYIVGASERENAQFRKKRENKINLNLQDCVELSCVKEFVLTSENYNDIMKVRVCREVYSEISLGMKCKKKLWVIWRLIMPEKQEKKILKNIFMNVVLP